MTVAPTLPPPCPDLAPTLLCPHSATPTPTLYRGVGWWGGVVRMAPPSPTLPLGSVATYRTLGRIAPSLLSSGRDAGCHFATATRATGQTRSPSVVIVLHYALPCKPMTRGYTIRTSLIKKYCKTTHYMG